MSQVIVDNDIAEDIAYEVKSYVETAVGEMGHQFESIDDLEWNFPRIHANLKGMKPKPWDWKGWLSDELYNDARLVQDLAGDRIYDLMSQKGLKPSDNATFQAYAKVVASYFTHVTLDWSA